MAGWHLKINPFDEPNVTESKNNTKNILSGFERSGEFPDQDVSGRYGKLSLVACGGPRRVRPVDQRSLSALLKRFFTGARPPEYFAALGYLKSDRRTEAAMAEIRRLVAARTRMSTLRGYGPRYLHSVGQLYKGGPGIGRFVVFVKGHYGHLPIPERKYEFGQLIAAQAIGDAQALMKRKFPTLVFAIDGSPAAGLEQFARALKRALRK